MTMPHLMSSPRFWMTSCSFNDMTSAIRSGSTVEKPRNNSGDMAMSTSKMMTANGAMFTRKALNDRALVGADDDVRWVADQCRCAADVRGEYLGHQHRYRVDL